MMTMDDSLGSFGWMSDLRQEVEALSSDYQNGSHKLEEPAEESKEPPSPTKPLSHPPTNGFHPPAGTSSKQQSQLQQKGQLIPHYVKSKGIVRQHIDSYNYFIHHDIKNILLANNKITCDVDENFYLRYTDIRIGK